MVAGQILFKYSAENIASQFSLQSFASLFLSKEFCAAIVIYAICSLLWIFIISKNNLSIAYPIAIGLCVVFLNIFELTYMKKPYNFNSLAGTIFVIIGIAFFNKK